MASTFLTEVLFMKALVAFELENLEECQKALIIYDNYGYDYDRNRCDSSMLKLWITPGASSDDFTEADDSRTRFVSSFQRPQRCLGRSYILQGSNYFRNRPSSSASTIGIL